MLIAFLKSCGSFGPVAFPAKLEEISGQRKTPTLDYGGDVLSDFGIEELEAFLKRHRAS